MSLNRQSPIDYIQEAHTIGRQGCTLSLVTGCKHWLQPDVCAVGTGCYAYGLVLYGRLKGHPSYPYGFEPTFHPERVKKYGGKPKLIFLNDMGDVGGDWEWKNANTGLMDSPKAIAMTMTTIVLLNPQHIFLLLTKRPEWYGIQNWPSNVWRGFTATCNDELHKHEFEIDEGNVWMSLEPWLDDEAPNINGDEWDSAWLAIGGLSGPNARPVSDATQKWLMDKSIQAKRFMKRNAFPPRKLFTDEEIYAYAQFPREYPVEWRVE